MASLGDIRDQLEPLSKEAGLRYLQETLKNNLTYIAGRRGTKNALIYASAFLQKGGVPSSYLAISREDINGFMAGLHGMQEKDSLTLVLHTPGGDLAAAHTIVDYLHYKFPFIDVIVPTFAMSAGTMICLATNQIVMGRQSQLGPIDPQFVGGGVSMPAQSIRTQFEDAKKDIAENPNMAHVWAPILRQITPSLLQEARNACAYGEGLVKKWLQKRMFNDREDKDILSSKVASYFSDVEEHKIHGSRVSFDSAKEQGLAVQLLEDDQDLQDASLTAYHIATLIFERTVITKLIMSNHGKIWVKSFIAP